MCHQFYLSLRQNASFYYHFFLENLKMKIFNSLNPHLRVDILVDQFMHDPDSKVNSKISNIVVPLLSLHPTTSTYCSIGMNLYKSLLLSFSLKNQQGREAALCGIQLAITVTSIALSVLNPKAQFLFSNAIFLATETKRLGSHLYAGKQEEAGYSLLKIAHQLIYVGARRYETYPLTNYSLVLQGLYEGVKGILSFYLSIETNKYGESMEGLTYILLSLIRTNKASQLKRISRGY